MEVFLETERLVLRRLTLDDVDRIVELDADPAVMRYITGGTATPRQEIAAGPRAGRRGAWLPAAPHSVGQGVCDPRARGR